MCLLFLALPFLTRPAIPEPGPGLTFRKLIGDVRGRGRENLSVAVTEDETIYLLMRSGRLSIFRPDGTYRESQQVKLDWPVDGYYLSSQGSHLFLGRFEKDFPWAVALTRQGKGPGRFDHPKAGVLDRNGRTFIADTGNGRIQLFEAGQTDSPAAILPVNAKPLAMALHHKLLAILTDQQELLLYRVQGNVFSSTSSVKVGSGARALAIEAVGSILVAFNGGPDRFHLARFRFSENGWAAPRTIVPPYTQQWPNLFPSPVPLKTGPNGHLWFTDLTFGAVLELDPQTDRVQVRARGLHQPKVVAFPRDGSVLISIRGPRILKLPNLPGGPAPVTPYLNEDQLYREPNVPLWDLLPDGKGGLYLRLLEEGYRKGWPALALQHLHPDGRADPFLDFGPLFAKRRRFGPWEAAYSLAFAPDGNIVLVALPLVGVLKVTTQGRILWEAGRRPQGTGDPISFSAPRDLAVDHQGRIWIVDSDTNRIYCLSPEGRLLYEMGGYANIDGREGKGFHSPTGIAVTFQEDREYLYIGDAGNQRLVKYELK